MYSDLFTHLGDLIGEHVAIIVVADHPEAAIGPADDLKSKCKKHDV